MHPLKELWWQKYRRGQFRKPKLSLEMIMRKSFVDIAKEYVKHSSIAGVKQICDPNIGNKYKQATRFTWIMIFTAMVSVTCYFLVYIWFGTISKPLIVTMESSTYPISDIDFPAVAICSINRISKKALAVLVEELIELIGNDNKTLFKDARHLCMQMGRLIDYSWVESLRSIPIWDKLAKDSFDTKIIIDVMKDLAPSCKEILLKCQWAGTVVDCMSIFAERRTARGHCCAFNYILDYDSADRPNKTLGMAKRQTSAGYLQGLNVILDPKIDDYAYPLSNMMGFDVFLFDPTHFADTSSGRVIHRIIEANRTMLLELNSVKQVATSEVRKYPLSTRKCLFKDENQNQFGNMYSYSACIVSCRIKTVRSLCKCTPYFLPIGKNDGPICSLDELRCLNKYKEKLLYLFPKDAVSKEGLEMELQDSLNCPECLPDCEFTQHFTTSLKIPFSMAVSPVSEFAHKEFIPPYGKEMDMLNTCGLRIYQTTAVGSLERLDVINYWFEVLSNVGGFAGIFLGFSIISIVEVIYFFVIRFLMLFYYNYKKYN